MAALKEARSYGLSCGRVSDGSRVSVFHVKLTDSALKAFESYRAHQDSVSLRPSIRFEGSQGHISIPQPDCPEEVRAFSFYLSNIGRDSPQGSFDCIQQYVSSHGDVHLDCLGSIQDKVTVCATDDSYQKARQSMAQAEEETRSRSAIVIKAGGRYMGKKVQFRKPAPGTADAVPSRKRATPINLASAIRKSGGSGASSVVQRPFRDRVLHLLALRPYRKAELLLRLQKDGLTQADKDTLDSLLQQKAVSATECQLRLHCLQPTPGAQPLCLTLSGTCLRVDECRVFIGAPQPYVANIHCLSHTPSGSEGVFLGGHMLWDLVLTFQCPQSCTYRMPGSVCLPSLLSLTSRAGLASLLTSQKRPQSTDFIDPLASKKPRISHFTQRAQPTLNGKLGAPNGHETLLPTLGSTPMDTLSSSHLPPRLEPPRLEPPRTHDPLADVSNDLGHSAQDYKHQEAAQAPAPASAPHLSLPLLTDFSQSERPAGSSHTHSRPKRKSKKHKDKERPPEDRPPAPQPDAPALLPDTPGLNGACASVPTSTSETTDYLLKYPAISSSEQRQSYKNDFNAEYSEYRSLHARIEQITRRFTQLDAQLRQLSQGSEEYETTRGQILQEYRKIKKTNTNYSREKRRCEYLHRKLAHIKRLIAEYDQRQLQAWP
ncbi:RNA polymerase II elongation factor ELL isoform X1 [Arvicola amphibius]|uniref:RNA polymerase II elongation factor ELL isoform X1 n=1 Tax=Arvicola amphibius TaxID=1047088 RepID=UPI0018E353CC|nr:RNA polymerase II elongation factor ELL isoform X1 [Arvicola amphibius]